jgi:hypothetical protein
MRNPLGTNQWGPPRSPEQRIADSILEEDRGYTTPCWVWQLAKHHKGYGFAWYQGKHLLAHQFSYRVLRGEVPEGLQLDHLCRVRLCVNPDHLEPVTGKENMRRGSQAMATHCRNGHERTEENIYTDPRGRRDCHACRRDRRRGFRG